MAEYARNFFIAIFLGCLLLGLFIAGTSSTNAHEAKVFEKPVSLVSTSLWLEDNSFDKNVKNID